MGSELRERLRAFVGSGGPRYLGDQNISSIGIGYKVKDGRRTNGLAVQFRTVVRKVPDTELEGLGSSAFAERIGIGDGLDVGTDVIEKKFAPSCEVVEAHGKSGRKRRVEPIMPGVSVIHPAGTAGTLGLIVYDGATGAPCILSNWHVLHTPSGRIGEKIVHPGPWESVAGTLLRSHLGIAGDCAVARVNGRGVEEPILELGVRVHWLRKPKLNELVIKSGRTTGVTCGRIRRVDTIAKIDYGGGIGERRIVGFEIVVDLEHPGPNGEISMGGDSGSVWPVVGEDGQPTDVMAGFHFAGEGHGDPDEHALACHAIFKKLEVWLTPPTRIRHPRAEDHERRGYDAHFVGPDVPLPEIQRGGGRLQRLAAHHLHALLGLLEPGAEHGSPRGLEHRRQAAHNFRRRTVAGLVPACVLCACGGRKATAPLVVDNGWGACIAVSCGVAETLHATERLRQACGSIDLCSVQRAYRGRSTVSRCGILTAPPARMTVHPASGIPRPLIGTPGASVVGLDLREARVWRCSQSGLNISASIPQGPHGAALAASYSSRCCRASRS